MVVITVTACPPKLRGDLSMWMFEIDTGVFVGSINSRIREEIWERVCKNIGNGRASMAFSTNNEQGLDFKIHNTQWNRVDFDGINLVRRVHYTETENDAMPKAEVYHKIKSLKSSSESKYTVVDIETTGTGDDDEIIEIGAVRIRSGEILSRFNVLVKALKSIPADISKLTGITDDMLEEEGVSLDKAMSDFVDFIGDDIIVGHNISFDINFLRRACRKCGLNEIENRMADTMRMARKKIDDISSCKLTVLAEYFGCKGDVCHRALADCEMTFGIYEKLKEL